MRQVKKKTKFKISYVENTKNPTLYYYFFFIINVNVISI